VGDHGKRQRNARTVARLHVPTISILAQPGKLLGERPIVFGKGVDDEPSRGESREHLAQRMIPFVGSRRCHVATVRVGVGAVVDKRIVLLFEVAVDHPLATFVEAERQRVRVVEIKDASGDQKVRHHRTPGGDIGQPAERAQAHVDDVKALIRERAGCIVDIGADKGGSIGEPRAYSERRRFFNRCRGEVEAGDRRSNTSPAQRVHSEMALEVKKSLSRDVADSADLSRRRPGRVAKPALYVIEARLSMDGDAFVPVISIGTQPGIHRLRVLRRAGFAFA